MTEETKLRPEPQTYNTNPPLPGCDHQLLLADEKPIGFIGLKSRGLGLERCPVCTRENHCMAVLYGQCCWCGWVLPDEKVRADCQIQPEVGDD